MKKSLRYHPRFADDVVGAASWYETQSKPLADAFVKRVAEAVERLVRDPDCRGPGQFGVRYWPLRQFPFVIFYDVTAAAILIVGVMHTARDAEKWILRRKSQRDE